MTFKNFRTPEPHSQIVPVNMARVAYAERLRNPNNPTKFSGNIRLVFGKDFYLDVAGTETAEQYLDDLVVPIK